MRDSPGGLAGNSRVFRFSQLRLWVFFLLDFSHSNLNMSLCVLGVHPLWTSSAICVLWVCPRGHLRPFTVDDCNASS